MGIVLSMLLLVVLVWFAGFLLMYLIKILTNDGGYYDDSRYMSDDFRRHAVNQTPLKLEEKSHEPYIK